jgi:hypothetical protein
VAHNTRWEGQDAFEWNIRFLRSKAVEREYCGFSMCRLCHNDDQGRSTPESIERKICGRRNGTADLVISIPGRTLLVMPSGYIHYLMRHNVAPTSEEKQRVQAIIDDHFGGTEMREAWVHAHGQEALASDQVEEAESNLIMKYVFGDSDSD